MFKLLVLTVTILLAIILSPIVSPAVPDGLTLTFPISAKDISGGLDLYIQLSR